MEQGRIGPNAITRVAEALDNALGRERCDEIFVAAGLAYYRVSPPESMVEEAEVTALHQVLHARLPPGVARSVARDAGLRTAQYLLANRIPRPVQFLLRALPAPLAARVLLGTISRHAWTFVGNGEFRAELGQPVMLRIVDCPLARVPEVEAPVCDYFAATFERLFRALVHADARVREVECAATGAPACVFEVSWRRPERAALGDYSTSRR